MARRSRAPSVRCARSEHHHHEVERRAVRLQVKWGFSACVTWAMFSAFIGSGIVGCSGGGQAAGSTIDPPGGGSGGTGGAVAAGGGGGAPRGPVRPPRVFFGGERAPRG